MIRDAVFSPCASYRYLLIRGWAPSLPTVTFVCLNPSTATAEADDPTTRRCVAFARSWGFGTLYLVNLFAFRTASPAVLLRAADPIGPENDRWLDHAAAGATVTIAAWGNRGRHRQRAATVLPLLHAPHHLGQTRLGSPRHPLYLRASTRPQLWTAAQGPRTA